MAMDDYYTPFVTVAVEWSRKASDGIAWKRPAITTVCGIPIPGHSTQQVDHEGQDRQGGVTKKASKGSATNSYTGEAKEHTHSFHGNNDCCMD